MSEIQHIKRFISDKNGNIMLEVPIPGQVDVDVIVEEYDDHTFVIEEGNDGLIRVITVTAGIPHSMWFPDRDTYSTWRDEMQKSSDKMWKDILWKTPKVIR